MATYIEKFLSQVQYEGALRTQKPIVGESTLAITGASTLTGAVTMGSTLAVTGAATFTGAVTFSGGTSPTIQTQSLFAIGGPVVTAASGTDNACANGTITWSAVYIGSNMTLTGAGYLIGSVGGTDKVLLSLHDSTGALVANTALAGTTVGTAANWQAVDFTAPVAVTGGKIYYIAANFNGNTAKFRGYPGPGLKFVTGTASQTFGTPAAITPGTTFSANVGPISFIY